MQNGALPRRTVVDGPVPKHVQLRRILADQISSQMEVDALLPSERELMATYDVGRSTAREAVSQLIDHNMVYKVPGKGTFVRSPIASKAWTDDRKEVGRQFSMLSFSRELANKGIVPKTQVISVDDILNAEIADKLQIDNATPIHVIKRLRLGNGAPMALQTSYLPADIGAGLSHEALQEAQSLYVWLEQHGTVPKYAHEEYRAVKLNTEADCKLLSHKRGTAVFSVERLTFDTADRPFEYTTSILVGELYSLQVDLK